MVSFLKRLAVLCLLPASLWAQTKIDLTTQVKSSTLTTNTIPKWTGSTGLGNGCVLDDGTHAVRCDKGFDVNSLGAYVFWAVNNTVTGTTVNKMACDDGTGKVIICPSASSTTNNPLGVAIAADGATPGTSGSTGICIIGFCSVIMDNSATAGHYAQSSTTVNGDLSDVGATIPTNGQSYWYIFTGNSGAGTAAIFRNLTPSELNATSVSGGNGKNLQVQINGTAITKPIANLVNGTGITFATGSSGNTTTITPTVTAGGVTSVAMTVPTAEFAVAGSPITTSGTLAVTKATQNPNQVWAGPVSSSGANIVQSASTVCDNCTPAVLAMPSNVTAGHLLIVMGSTFSASAPTDNVSDSFSQAGGDNGNGVNQRIYYTCSAVGGATTITWAGGRSVHIHAIEVSGNATSSCQDTAGVGGTSGTSMSVSATGSVTSATELVVALFGSNSSSCTAISPGPNYTQIATTFSSASASGNWPETSQVFNSDTGLSGVQTATASCNLTSSFQNFNIATFKLTSTSSAAQPGFRTIKAVDLQSAFPLAVSELSAPAGAVGSDIIYPDSTQHTMSLNNNNTGNVPISRVRCVNVTPVTVSANVSTDQNLMACTISANTLNVVGRTLKISTAAVYSTPAGSTAQITLKAKLCTVSGCGSGTVVTLVSMQSAALGALAVTNGQADLILMSTTQTGGASSAYEAHGQLFIDLNAAATGNTTSYGDGNTATVGTIDSTGQLFLQITGAFSAASASNSMSERQLVVEEID